MRATASLRIWFSPSSGVDLRQESYRPSVSRRCRPPSIWYRVYRACEAGDRSARRDLCGGRGAILVPTATIAASQNIGSRLSPSDGSDIPCGHADAARCQAPAPHANADAASLCSSPSG